jgi:hypothetical protein
MKLVVPLVMLGVLMSGSVGPADAEVQVMVGEISDRRTTGEFFSGLQVQLKILGDILADAKFIRLVVEAALDETGRNLVDEENREPDFKEFDSSSPGQVEITLSLKNPARQAMAIQELSGSVELFIPQKDAGASVTVKNIQKHTGVPIAAPALKAAGLDVTMLTKEQYEAHQKAEEKKLKEEVKSQTEDWVEASAESLVAVFGEMFGGLTGMSENSLAFLITDPQSRLIRVEFQDENGQVIRTSWRTKMGQIQMYEFDEQLPTTASVTLYVATPKSLIKVPFKLTSIPLP